MLPEHEQQRLKINKALTTCSSTRRFKDSKIILPREFGMGTTVDFERVIQVSWRFPSFDIYIYI